MKIIMRLSSLVFISLSTTSIFSQWVTVGSAGFSMGESIHQSLAMHSGTPYVAFSDSANSYKTTVMKFDGANWINVGNSGFSAGLSQYQSLAFDGNTPYVAYSDFGNGQRTTVMRFDGINWTPVGTVGFSTGSSHFQSLVINNGIPYIAYRDIGNGFKTVVMKFDGTNWINVGAGGFTSFNQYQSLVIDDGTPYIAYQDGANSNKTTVKQFDGTNWVTIGLPGFSDGVAYYQSLAVKNGVPYVAYQDGFNGQKTTVMKFNGTSWIVLGSSGFSNGISKYQSLVLKDTVPFVAYSDGGNSERTTVMKYSGTGWKNIDSSGFSTDSSGYQSLVSHNGLLYIAFSDGGYNKKTTVMKLCSTDSTLSAQVCDTSYISPSGNYTWSTTGIYLDTLTNSSGCDSLLTVDLTVGSTNFRSLSINACRVYLSPSEQYAWTSSGVYNDTISNASGCDSILEINLSVTDTIVSIIPYGSSLSANIVNASYQWLDCTNGFSASTNDTNMTFVPYSNGSYAVEVTQNGCTDTSACYTVSGIGIGETWSETNSIIYPNPSNKKFTVDLGLIYSGTITLSDITGKNLQNWSIDQQQIFNFEIKNPKGMYILAIQSENQKATMIVVKK